jgi:hypothetical protein
LFAFLGLKYLNSLMPIQDPGSGMDTVWIRDGKKSDLGSKNRDKHPGSATLKETCSGFWDVEVILKAG